MKRKSNAVRFFTFFGPYLAAFFVPILVMLIVFWQRAIWPFGDRCFLRTDLYHQYAPFFQELHTKLTTGGSLFYSWNIGGGTNFWTLMAYYLSGPFNYVVGLIPQEYVIEFVTGLIVNKLALMSLSMAVYLNVRHKKSGAEGYMGAFIGIFYSLSGYMAAYNWNVMWLDCLWLFPLVILGVERLFKENKGLLYCVTLGFSILTNYYIAIMSCAGVALYCFFLLATERQMLEKFWLKFLKFLGFTVVAVMFSAVVLIPYINYFSMTASASNSFKWEWRSYFSVFEMLGRHLINVEVHTGLDHWPNIFCSVSVFLLVPLYYLNKKVTLREKIGYTVLLLFFYFSFSTRAMDYIWHIFHIPNSLPCRQAYIYIFLLLTMCYRGLMGLKDRSYRDITFAMIASLLFVFVTQYLERDNELYANYVIWISAVFMILYTILFYIHKRGRLFRDIVIVLFIALAAIEMCVNTSATSVPTVGRNDYTSYDTGVRTIMEEIREKEGEDSFYRVEKWAIRTKNDGAWLDYPSISTFSSVANANLTEFYHLIGMESSTNAYGSVGQTFFTNMLLGVKYFITHTEWTPNEDLYTLVDSNSKNVWVYENKYVLPLGYMIPSTVIDNWNTTSLNSITNQNDLAFLVSGVEDLFESVKIDYTSDTNVSVTFPESGYYYVYVTKTGPKDILVKHDGYSRKYSNLNRGYLIDLSWVNAGETVTFENKEENSTKKISMIVYRINPDKLAEVYEAFSESPMIIDSYSDTEIEAHIDAKFTGDLMTTIPDEEGWEVYVDGVKVEKLTVKDAYIMIPLTEGYHTISFKFHVVYLIPGLILTLLATGIMLAVFLLWIVRRRRLKREAAMNYAAPEAIEEVPAEVVAETVAKETSAETAVSEKAAEAPADHPEKIVEEKPEQPPV